MEKAIAVLTETQLTERLPGWFNYVAEEAILKLHAHIGYHTAEIVAIRAAARLHEPLRVRVSGSILLLALMSSSPARRGSIACQRG